MNYELLPEELKNSLQVCDSKNEHLLHKCENFHGRGNCEKINPFTYVKKCPENYIRDDLTRCKKNCEIKLQKFNAEPSNENKNFQIIDHNCQKNSSYFLDQIQKFKSLEECQEEYQFCEESDEKNIFLESCPLNYRKVAFMCIPYCLEELSVERRDKIVKHSDYCLIDYVNLGMPIFDF